MNHNTPSSSATSAGLFSGRAYLLALSLATLGACAADDMVDTAGAPNALPPASVPPVNEQSGSDDVRTGQQALVDLTRNAPKITAWLTDDRAQRHARADAFYAAAYDGGDLGGRTLRVVTTTADSGPGSLRDAIAQTAVEGAIIAFDPTVFRPTEGTVIRLQSPLQGVGPFFNPGLVNSDVIIVAPAPGAVILDGDSDNNGTGDTLLFDWQLGSGSFFRELTLVGLELRNGFSPDLNKAPVVSNGGPVVLVDCWVHHNVSEFPPGPLLCPTDGGAVRQVTASDGGGLVVFRSVFSDNVSPCFGGAIITDAGLIAESVFARNRAAREGGAIYQWQAINGGLLFDSVTISDNEAGVAGGGVDLQSVGCEFRQSVVVGNTAPVDPDIQTLSSDAIRSVFGQPAGFTLQNIAGSSFFNEQPETLSDLLPDDAQPYPVVELRFCSAAVDLGDPVDNNPRDLRGSDRPLDLSIGPPATDITDSGALESFDEFNPCPFVQPVIGGVPTPGTDLVTTTAPVWRHHYGSTQDDAWQRCATAAGDDCVDIPGTSAANYRIVAADFGTFLRRRSTLDNQVDTDSMFSNRIGPVTGITPTFVTGPMVTGTVSRCGELSLTIGDLAGVPLPIADDIAISWRTCNASNVCTEVADDTLTYRITPADVGLRLEVVVTITTLGGTVSATVDAGLVGDNAAPVCTIESIAYDADAEEYTVTGTATSSGECGVSLLSVTRPDAPPTQPSQISINGDGTFETTVDGADPSFDVFRCAITDEGLQEAEIDYTAVVGDCTEPGLCNQTTRDCTTPANESDPCGPAADACQASTCAAGVCVQQVTVCDDSNLCTDDSCAPATGCVFTNNTAPCDDGNACTQSDFCTAGACAGSNPVACSTENPCLTSACDTTTGSCVEAPVADDTPCLDNDVCNGDETCQAGTCTSGSDLDCDTLNPGPCEGAICDAVNGCEIVVLADDTPCNSDTICSGACNAGLCEGGVAIDCTSDDACETGTCDEENFECVFTPIDGCGEDVGPDAGPDAGTDAGPDAGPDAGTDAGTDTSDDAGFDTEVQSDVEPDIAIDSGADTAAPDTVEDAGSDADTSIDGAEDLTIEGYLAGTGLIGCSSVPSDRNPAPVALVGLVGMFLLVQRRR